MAEALPEDPIKGSIDVSALAIIFYPQRGQLLVPKKSAQQGKVWA